MSLRTYHHFSNRSLTLDDIYATNVLEEFARPDSKPVGIWLSDETCESSWSSAACSMFGKTWFDDKKAHEVVVDHDDSVLLLSSAKEIEDFTLRYMGDLSEFADEVPVIRNILGDCHIRWSDVGRDYKGIVITPYVAAARYRRDAIWYYTWDCSSGCIWDPTCIRDVREIPFDVDATTS